jgi:YidC/Oxa1 family membrane protein insertase
MDRKTIVAVALCVLFLIFYRPLLHLIGWDKYLAPATPPATTQTKTAPDTTTAQGATGLPEIPPPSAPTPGAPAPAAGGASLFAGSPSPTLAKAYELDTPLYRATFSNIGARLVSVELKHYVSAHGVRSRNGSPIQVKPGEEVPAGDRVVLAGGPLFGIDLGSQDHTRSLGSLAYAVSESLNAAGERMAITFTARDSAGAFVRQTYRVRPDTYAIDLEVELRGLSSSQIPEYSLATRSWPLLTESDLSQDMRSLRATSLVGTNLHREHAGGLIKAPKIFDGNAAWAGVQTRYFFVCVAASEAAARGVVSHAERRPMTSAEQEQLGNVSGGQMEIASNALVVSVPSELKPVQRFVLYTGPSEVSSLRRLKLGLERSVDLGWSWVQPFSKAMLELLRWLYGLVRNYGVAIILLATLIRVLLHPLNMVSMKSMRAMQRLQPEIERLREKYKNDPQAMNTAIMGLYKEYKVNPAGGCFPMLLQIPVFFALYQVLFNAIELRQAPFFGWINDLSAPDLLAQVGPVSIRLLPVLMLGSGFLSQKLTPSDPRQLPTMYMMNVVMLVFFYNLPSGLVLYWTLMNLLTALQQWLLIRQDGGKAVAPAPTAVPARAMAGGRGKVARR